MLSSISINLISSFLYEKGANLSKTEKIHHLLKKLRLSPENHDFEIRYVEALVELKEAGKNQAVFAFFKEETIQAAFRAFFYGEEETRSNDEKLNASIAHAVEALKVGDDIKAKDVDIADEIDQFWKIFRQKVQESRPVKDVELIEKFKEIQSSTEDIKEAMQKMQEWLAANQKESVKIGDQFHALNSLTAKSYLTQEAEKIFNIDTIGTAHFHIYNGQKIPKYLTPPPFIPTVFLGREDDIQLVHQKLFSGQNLLLLVNGEGGIGKTSLAAVYYRRFEHEYSHMAWVFAEQSIVDALLKLAHSLKIQFEPTMPNTERLPILLAHMRELKRPCLLIIDNANTLSDLKENHKALQSCLNFHLLLTSRIAEFSEAETYKITPLIDQEAKNLFLKYYPKHKPENDELLDNMLRAIGKNTLVIELLAKNLRNFNRIKTHYGLPGLVADLQDKGLFGLQNKPVTTAYHASGDSLREEEPEAIIEAMYDLGELSEAERKLLSVFAVLPAENIPFENLESLLPDEAGLEDTLLSLSQKGWLDFNEDDGDFKVSPVVQEITIRKNENLLLDCGLMIHNLHHKLDYEPGIGHLKNITYEEAVLWVRFGENVINSMEAIAPNLADLSKRLGNYHKTTGNIEKATSLLEGYVQIYQTLYESEPQNQYYKDSLAASYQNLGMVQEQLGNLSKALKLYQKYHFLIKELYEAYPTNVNFKNGLAISYEKLGETHTALGNLQQALTFFEKDADLTKELYEAYPTNVNFKNGLAISYSKLGETHTALGNLQQALTFFEDETRLFEELYEAYPTNVNFKNGLAISYEKLGETHTALGNLQQALTFFEDETRLFEELYEAYPTNVNFKNGLAISYSKLGETHTALGNLQQALTFFEDETRLFEELYEAYPTNVNFKNGLAISYEKLGETHTALGNLQQALTFFEDETRLFEELYEAYPTNVNFKNGLAISYSKLGETHTALGNLQQALTFFEDETRLFEELYEAYPTNVNFKNGLAISYLKLGQTHRSSKNLEGALEFLKKYNLLKMELYETYPSNVSFKNGLAVSYENIGSCLKDLGKKTEANDSYLKAEAIWIELVKDFPAYVEFQKNLDIVQGKLS